MDKVWNIKDGVIPGEAYPPDNLYGYLVITDGETTKAVTQKEEIIIPDTEVNAFCKANRLIRYKSTTTTPKYHLKNEHTCLVVAEVNDRDAGWIVYNIKETPDDRVYASEYSEPGEWESPIAGSVSFGYEEGLDIFINSLESLMGFQKHDV